MKTASGATLITNGTLVDGTGAPAVPDAAVVIEDGHIRYAGPASGAPETPPGAQRIDAGGGTSCRGWSRPTFTPLTSTSPQGRGSLGGGFSVAGGGSGGETPLGGKNGKKWDSLNFYLAKTQM